MSSSLGNVFNLGPQISAQILGSPYQQFRPSGANNPLGVYCLIAEILAWITADKDSMANKPNTYAKPVFYGLFDPTITQVGDYLVGPLGTFFISSQDVPMPMQLVSCNHTISISTAADFSVPGAQSTYGGDQVATETIIATNWPCSLLQGTKGETGTTKLPGDVKQPWSAVLLPVIPGVIISNDMILTDDLGQRHITSSCELSDLGWRITASLATN